MAIRSPESSPFQPAARQLVPEWMDDPDLPPDLHGAALAGLTRLNFWSASARPIWRAIEDHCRATRRSSATLLDLACGAGDVPLALARRAAEQGIELRVTGCDVSPVAVERAQRRADALSLRASFVRCDVLHDKWPGEPDIVTCSLFLHHLREEQAVGLLRRMGDAARQLLLVSDLERCRSGHALAWLASRLVTRSPVVHHDAPQSVAAAFSLEVLRQLTAEAQLEGACLRRVWPCRILIRWRRSA